MGFNKLKNMCRCCLATDRNSVSASLYEAVLKDLTGVNISPSDGLPQWLCYECTALLHKCVRFRNKIKRSHGMLCQYVLESVPFEYETAVVPLLNRTIIEHHDIPDTHIEQFRYNKHSSLHLTRTPVEAYDFPAVQTEQVEVPIVNTAMVNIDMSDFTNIVNVHVKCEPVDDTYEEHATEQECRERIPHMNFASKLSSCNVEDTRNVNLITPKHEERTEQEEPEDPIEYSAVSGIKMPVITKVASVKERDDIVYGISEDNLTAEEYRIDQPDQEGQIEQEQTTRDTVRARQHLLHHIDVSSTPHIQIGEKECNVNDGGVNGNSCIKSYICDECDKCFSNSSLLIAHIRVHSKQTSNQNQYQCNVCMKYFTRKYTYNAHMRVHNGEKPYKCNACMKCFSQSSTRNRHMRIHTGEKPYKCDVCMKCFGRKYTYDIHMRVHTGEKPYQCDKCMKCFSQCTDYQDHMRIHNGEKPYKCDMCMKCFRCKSSYDSHIRIHTGEKPYKCDVCLKCFGRKYTYNLHMRVHTGEKPYKCDVCMKCFSRRSVYREHMRIHTREKPYR